MQTSQAAGSCATGDVIHSRTGHDRTIGRALWLTALCLFINFFVQWRQPHVAQFSSEATRVAEALTQGRGFSDPYLTGPSGPTAQMAPLYPFLYAGICLVFGTGPTGWFAVTAFTSLVWSTQWIFVYKIAAFYRYARAGLSAAVLGCLLPIPGRLFKWEALLTGALLAWCAWLLIRILAGDTRKRTLIELGIASAAAVLSSPAAILIWPAWVLILGFRIGWSQTLRVCLWVAAIAIIPIAAWTVRNYTVFHHVFFIRDDAGMAWVSSNNDCATPLVSKNIASGCFGREHPSGSLALLHKMIAEGEYNYSSAEMRRNLQWIDTHPGRFAVLSLQRAAYFWFPVDSGDRASFWYGIYFSVLTVVSLTSLYLIRCGGFQVVGSALLAYSATYYTVQFEQRYRYPVLWITILLACVGVSHLLTLMANRRVRRANV